MNYQCEYNGVTFDIDYSVDGDGDYDQFDIEVSGQCVNEVLSEKVISALELLAWEKDYIPSCQQHNDDLRIARYESSQA